MTIEEYLERFILQIGNIIPYLSVYDIGVLLIL